MTARPMTDEERAMKIATGTDWDYADCVAVARALLSTSAAERGMRELNRLRNAGWRVAVHNDYRLNGDDATFWLFTHPNGRWIKGEGPTDADALVQAYALSGIEPGEDEQARGQGRSAPISTDTKGTSK